MKKKCTNVQDVSMSGICMVQKKCVICLIVSLNLKMKEHEKPKIIANKNSDLMHKWLYFQCNENITDKIESMSKSARRKLFNLFLLKENRADLIGRLHCL